MFVFVTLLLVLTLLGAGIAWTLGYKMAPPPITVTFRDSLVGIGKVVILQNPTMHHLYNLRIVVTSPRPSSSDPNGKSASMRIDDDMEPLEVVEIGWMELAPWVLEEGETIRIYADDFVISKSVVVPK